MYLTLVGQGFTNTMRPLVQLMMGFLFRTAETVILSVKSAIVITQTHTMEKKYIAG